MALKMKQLKEITITRNNNNNSHNKCKKKEFKHCRLSTGGWNTLGIHLKSHWLRIADPVQADVESDLQGSFQSMSDDTKYRPQSQS